MAVFRKKRVKDFSSSGDYIVPVAKMPFSTGEGENERRFDSTTRSAGKKLALRTS